MSEDNDIVVYGASGYTGQIIMERLAARGMTFVAAGRDRARLEAAVGALPPSARAHARIEPVKHDRESLAALFRGAKIVVNVTGPFGQLGRPVIEAALDARCHYLDTTGETDWILDVRNAFGDAFAKIGRIACPALAYMWTAGQLACELALEEGDIDSLDVVYSPGSLPTIASTHSFLRMVTKTQYRLANKQLEPWPTGASVSIAMPHVHEVLRGLPWGGGCEPIWYERDPRVRNCRVVVAFQAGPMVDWILDCTRKYQEAAPGKSQAELEAMTNAWASAIAVTPPREDLDVNRSVLSCRARGAFGAREIVLYGSAPYEQTGAFVAEGAQQLLCGDVSHKGFVSPAQAFGARQLLNVLSDCGLQQPPPSQHKSKSSA